MPARKIARRKLAEIADSAKGPRTLPHIGKRRDHILLGLRAIPAAHRAVIALTADDRAKEVHVFGIIYSGGDWIGRAGTRQS